MAVIDADAHVVETERTWEYMEEAESLFKPEVVVPKAGGDREYWLIEGRAFAKNTNIGKDTPDEAREVSNILPNPPDTLEALRRIVGDDPFPEVFDALRPAPDVADLSAAVTKLPGPSGPGSLRKKAVREREPPEWRCR